MNKFSVNRVSGTSNQRSVLYLLVFVVLVPTISVLWFMTKAVENERFAVRQSLSEVLELRLADTRRALDEHWQQVFSTLSDIEANTKGAATFYSIVQTGLVDSIVLRGPAGQIVYPNSPDFLSATAHEVDAAWMAAERVELSGQDPAAAAELYATIADNSSNPNLIARALLAESRCRLLAGQKEIAIALLTESLQQPRLQSATASSGRLIVPNAQLLALHIINDPHHSTFKAVAASLQEKLESYDDVLLTSVQRQFLVRELQQLAPSLEPFAMLEAEELAAQYIDTEAGIAEMSILRRSAVPDVWHVALPGDKIVALFRGERIRGEVNKIIASQNIPQGTVIEASLAATESTTPTLGITASQHLPDWQLSYSLLSSSVLSSLENGQVASYLWTGILVIIAALCLAIIMARYLTRQLAQAQLKNDLVTIVSHELKTPLSSMRVLVDTLLSDKHTDAKTTQDYLRIISKENERLSQLIDNFLNYSRMSQSGQVFTLKSQNPGTLAESAAQTVKEKFEHDGFNFQIDIQSDLPEIQANEDALVTALVNLLDNAYKYSGDSQHVKLQVYQQEGFIVFSVIDYGIGLSKKEKGKVFEKFYRADQRLTSAISGVGLGLSIVQSIVDAHSGTIKVSSSSGQGSTFSISIPISVAEKTNNTGFTDD